MSLHIPENCNKIHLLFSGGVDSTILLYLLLLEQQKTPELEIKCYGLDMTNNGTKYNKCKEILTELEHKFNVQIPFQNYNRHFILRDFIELLLSVETGYVFSGCNLVLDFLNPTNFIAGDTPPVRGNAFNELHIRPFINMDKGQIISYYVNHNILDLLNMTYSCGFNLKHPCGACYFCLERDWGMKQCGISF